MIQDIAPHTYHNEYKPVPPDADSTLLVYDGRSVLLSQASGDCENADNPFHLPHFKELEEKIPDLYTNYIYLFSIDEERFYLIPNLDPALLPGYAFYDVRILRGAEPKYLAFAAITGYQLFFCTKTGASAAAAENQ